MPEDIVTDNAPEIETPVDSAVEAEETPTDDVETPETPEGEAPETPETPEAEEDEPVIGGTKLSEKAKAHLAALKATDPKLAAQLKNALFGSDAFKRAVPGGLKEVNAMKETLTSVGGVEGIQALKQESQEFKALDAQFAAGDPKFVDQLAASPDAFVKLAPAMFAKFAEVSPEGYGSYVSQVMVADMMANNVPLALERLSDFIGDNPKAQEIWKQLAGYVNRINTLSKQEVKPPAKKEEAKPDDTERQKFQQEKEEFTRNQWRTAADSNRMTAFNGEWARQTTGLKVNDAQGAAIKELYASRLGAALRNTPQFNATVDKYFKAGDQDGYVRYISSIYKQEIPKALRSAIDAVMPNRKPGPKPGQAAATVKPTAQGTGEAGYAWVAAQPRAATVDWSRTDVSQIAKGRATLADGKKVQWKT